MRGTLGQKVQKRVSKINVRFSAFISSVAGYYLAVINDKIFAVECFCVPLAGAGSCVWVILIAFCFVLVFFFLVCLFGFLSLMI